MNHISRQTFDLIFEKCMTKDTIYYGDASTGKITPVMVIRDFDTCENPITDDREFTDNDKAWEYFKKLNLSRVMDVSGEIYLDSYD